MLTKGRRLAPPLAVAFSLLSVATYCPARSADAREDVPCVFSVLNRSAEGSLGESWVVPNVPANTGRVRVRVTCSDNGVTRFGQSGYIAVQASGVIQGIVLRFDEPTPVPERLALTTTAGTLASIGEAAQLTVTATYPDGHMADVTPGAAGTNYTSSNPRIASVSADGLVTALAGGTVIVNALNDGTSGLIRIMVVLGGDTDSDGIPDELEQRVGMSPNDPVDALEDFDRDGLTNKQELLDFATDIRKADTDGDGLTDGREVGIGTNPAVFDTDGDGLSDGLEVECGSDPLDPRSDNLSCALTAIEVRPAVVTLIVNTIVGEASRQLRVTGQLKGGGTVDLTSQSRGTSYTSSDLGVVNFGDLDGLLFSGSDGQAVVTVANSGFSVGVPVTVQTFAPTALSFVDIPGFANNVDVEGDMAYVAAGSAGLQVVDVSDRGASQIIGNVDTPGNANGVRVRGGLAFVADGAKGLAVVDVSTPTAPSLIAQVDTPGEAWDVAVAGDRVYVADGAAGLQVIDVSDPTNPNTLGGVDTPGTAKGVDVSGDRAVIADGGNGLHVVDVSNPTSPSILGSVGTSDARDVALDGNFAYVADYTGSLVVVDLGTPSAPRVVAATSPSVGGYLQGVAKLRRFVFGADVFFVNGVPIVDVTDPASPNVRARLDFPFRDDNGTGIAVDDQYVYLTAEAGNITENGSDGTTRLYIGQYQIVQDTAGIPPTATITSPSDGATFLESSLVTVSVSASDDVMVTKVQFTVDDQVVGADTTAPYEFAVRIPHGAASIRLGAVAFDLAGDAGPAAPVMLNVLPDQPPSVRITAPPEGTTVIEGTTLSVTAEASDDVGVAKVEFLVDGAVAFTDTQAPYQFTVTVPVAVASLTLGAVAEDVGGRRTAATEVPVGVIPDPGTTVAGRVTDRQGTAVVGAQVDCLGVAVLSGSDGTFRAASVPTILGPVSCTARAISGMGTLSGRSQVVDPVVGGTTDVGGITISPVGPLYPEARFATGGPGVFAVATGDLNGDGAADVVAINYSAQEVAVLLNNGDGTLQSGPRSEGGGGDFAERAALADQQAQAADGATHWPVGFGPQWVALGDLNGDGARDIVTANFNSGDLSALLGNGDGTFQPEQRVNVGLRPYIVSLVDLNNDGALDIVAPGYIYDEVWVTVLLGTGTGGFGPPTLLRTRVGGSLVTADVNRDGHVDVVLSSGTDTDSTVAAVFLGNGDGTLQPQQNFAVDPSDSGPVAVGDLNGDTAPDIVMAGTGVSVLLGDGAGGFAAPQRHVLSDGQYLDSLALADLDGDGSLDVSGTSSGIVVLLGRGDGSFSSERRFEVGPCASSVVASDLNRDGIVDLTAADFCLDQVLVNVGTGDGTFPTRTDLTVGSFIYTMAVGDLNADGVPDAVTTDLGSATMSVLLGDGAGSFGPPQTVANDYFGIVRIADVNADGFGDALATNGNGGISVFLGNGDGSFQPDRRAAGESSFYSLRTADLNADGRQDIVATSGNGEVVVAVLLGDGTGGFSVAGQVTVGECSFDLAVGDVDGDLILDVVVPRRCSPEVSILYGKGDGTFRDEQAVAIPPGDAYTAAVGDVNGDGALDIVVPDSSRNQVSVLLNGQDGTFELQGPYAVGVCPAEVVVQDLDADGVLDIATANGCSEDVSVLLGQRDGTFKAEQIFGAARNVNSIAAADLNGDGAPDLVAGGDTLSLLIHR